jgi:hypothetical protein
MNKFKTLLFLTFFSVVISAQKTDTAKKTFSIPIPKSDFFNAIKTYDIIIQGTDQWGYSKEYSKDKTFESFITNSQYKNDKQLDSISPDLKILVGFTATKSGFKDATGRTNIVGDVQYLLLGKNNEIIVEQSVNKTYILEKSTYKTHEADLANTLSIETYKFLDQLLITKSEKEFTFNYGLFEKTENIPELVEFNAKTDELLVKLQGLSFDDAYLENMQTFYKSYIGKQFGKIKEKDLNKVIYLNLSLIEIFKVNFTTANEYLAKAKEGAGFISFWPGEAQGNIDQLAFINQSNFTNKVDNLNSQSVYYITTIGTAYYKKKTFEGTFLVPRFKPGASGGSGMASLDSGYTPNLMIYQNKIFAYDYPNSNKFNIKTTSGKDLYFKKLGSDFIMVEKIGDDTYKGYETISNDVYTSKDGDDEKIVLKK